MFWTTQSPFEEATFSSAQIVTSIFHSFLTFYALRKKAKNLFSPLIFKCTLCVFYFVFVAQASRHKRSLHYVAFCFINIVGKVTVCSAAFDVLMWHTFLMHSV